MLIKTGDGKILDIIKENDDRFDDNKIKKALRIAKNIIEDGNKTDSTIEVENNK